ncbi:uncharacterized protein LOC129278296 isoform X1 [Lytechinus pictus]|uniref:uncharacterized protein LOC129278296 isoform X1 n=1 Tax=Lytechinus pictus TaxID=7653 RepID=UPI0030BA275C
MIGCKCDSSYPLYPIRDCSTLLRHYIKGNNLKTGMATGETYPIDENHRENKISMKGPGFRFDATFSTTKFSCEVEIVLQMQKEKEIVTNMDVQEETNISVELDTAPEKTSGSGTLDEEPMSWSSVD